MGSISGLPGLSGFNRNKVLMTALLLTSATAVLSLTGLQHSAQAQSVQQTSFAVPAGSLSQALKQFGRQSGLQVTFLASATSGKQSAGVIGRLSNAEALSRILQGSGLNYSFPNGATVAISAPVNATSDGSAPDGSVILQQIQISSLNSAVEAVNNPYKTAGSVSHISTEQLERVPVASAGDIFINTPGVISAGGRVGASINPNIRGLQGNGRVISKIDGARQSTSTYRGYIGNREEVYIDPDMIAGVDIAKGPGSGVGVGGIGGSINFRTLQPDDIVKDGKEYGLRIKTDLGSNTSSTPDKGTRNSADRPSFFNGDAWSGSVAGAVKQENFDFIAAYSKRKTGNYFAGTKVPDGIVFGTQPGVANAPVAAGAEVFNTSQDTQSFLAKGTMRWADAHSLELGYINYDSKYGEIDELSFAPWIPFIQLPLTHTKVNTYTAKYKYEPEDNAHINLRANFWLSDIKADRDVNDWKPYGMRTMGGDISNTSEFETPIGGLTWENGVEIVSEKATAVAFDDHSGRPYPYNQMAFGPIGNRVMTSGFTKTSFKPTDWLTLNAGLRYDHYTSEGKDYLAKYPEQSGQRVNPNVGVVIEPLDGLQFYGQYTEGYRPPSLRESHWDYGYQLGSNPNLKPELAKNTEFGVNILKQGVFTADDTLRFKGSVFNNKYEDYIVRQNEANESFGYMWNNIDHARYKGVELSANYDARNYFIEGSYTRYNSITYCPTESTCTNFALGHDYGANYVPPQYSGSVTVGIRAFEEALTIGARVNFAAERSGGKATTIGYKPAQVWPSYEVYDIFGSYKFKDDLKLNFSMENIFDRYYVGALSSISVPATGRVSRISLTKSF